MTTPKYQEISNHLINEIKSGIFKQGEQFYSESEICERYHVSSTTAVKVLNLLQEKNYVVRFQGRGTFVAKEEHQQVVRITDLNMNKNQLEGVKVLSVRKSNDPQILSKLHLKVNGKYVEIVRLRLVGKKVVQYSTSYINDQYLKLWPNAPLDYYSSVYQRIREDSNLDPYKLPHSQINTAINVTDSEILHHFSPCPKRKLFIYQRRTTLLPTKNKTALEYAVSYKDPLYWGVQIDSIGV